MKTNDLVSSLPEGTSGGANGNALAFEEDGAMHPEVSVVMPCLNEEATIGTCISKAQKALDDVGVAGEIVVADNGSSDRSVEIAESHGARVVMESRRGYGRAYRTGIEAARGRYVIIGDSDDSYDFGEISRFLEPLQNGVDLVIGSRLRGEIKPGAMPWSHRYIGNPLLTAFLNLLYRTGVSDAHSGMRAFRRDAYERMNLRTAGMEFASEMVIKAKQVGLRIVEIPITLYKDGRGGASHLNTFRDGWRHLRFMLMYSPTHLFVIPGAMLMLLGLLLVVALLPGPLDIGVRALDYHFMFLGSALAIVGFQVLNIGFFAKIYSYTHGFEIRNALLHRLFRAFNLERGLLIGLLFFLVGLGANIAILWKWISRHFGELNEVRLAIFGLTFMVIGVQTVFSSFFLSILGIEKRFGREEVFPMNGS